MNGDEAENRGPSWSNVAVYLVHLREQTGTHVRIVIEAASRPDARYSLLVRAEGNKRRIGSKEVPIANASKRWPNRDHKTMPGLMYGLLMDIDQLVEGLAADEQAELPF
jgi:hypothetical protein